MAYVVRTKDNALDVGRAADQNESVDNDIAGWPYTAAGQIAVASSATTLAAKTPGWSADAPPASPSAYDDEFADASLSGNWTEYDPDAKTTWSEGVGGLKGTTATSAANNLNGLHKALPAGDFTIWAKFSLLTRELAQCTVGICLWENPAGDNKLAAVRLQRTTTAGFVTQMDCYEWSNHTTDSVAKLSMTTIGYGASSLYLRMRRTGTNYYVDFSFDGVGWRTPNSGTAITWSFTPTKMGFIVSNFSGENQVALVGFWRYLASDVGLTGIMEGNRF